VGGSGGGRVGGKAEVVVVVEPKGHVMAPLQLMKSKQPNVPPRYTLPLLLMVLTKISDVMVSLSLPFQHHHSHHHKRHIGIKTPTTYIKQQAKQVHGRLPSR